jgi:hypothetical protein
MQIELEVDTGSGPRKLTATMWAVVQWERKFKVKASDTGHAEKATGTKPKHKKESKLPSVLAVSEAKTKPRSHC